MASCSSYREELVAGHMESDPDSLAMANFIASIEESDVESDSDTEELANDSEPVEFTSSSFSFSLSNILQSITEDELVSSSTHGASVLQIVEYLQTMLDSTPVMSFYSILLEKVYSTIKPKGKKCGTLATVWRNFHILRQLPQIKSAWLSCISSLQISSAAISDLTLQVILKRVFNETVKQMTTHLTSRPSQNTTLTPREENIVRYMAGYVLLKISKKYPARREFIDTLHASCIDQAMTLNSNTEIWKNQVDRGGLIHVNDSFFKIIKHIELVCRKYLDTRAVTTNDENIMLKIVDECLQETSITQTWGSLALGLIQSSESNKILKSIIVLWRNIRVHSFAKKWAEKLDTGHVPKSTRKTLKRKGTEKDSSN